MATNKNAVKPGKNGYKIIFNENNNGNYLFHFHPSFSTKKHINNFFIFSSQYADNLLKTISCYS